MLVQLPCMLSASQYVSIGLASAAEREVAGAAAATAARMGVMKNAAFMLMGMNFGVLLRVLGV